MLKPSTVPITNQFKTFLLHFWCETIFRFTKMEMRFLPLFEIPESNRFLLENLNNKKKKKKHMCTMHNAHLESRNALRKKKTNSKLCFVFKNSKYNSEFPLICNSKCFSYKPKGSYVIARRKHLLTHDTKHRAQPPTG